MKIEIKTQIVENIKGQTSLYVIIGEGLNKVYINVGRKNFECINKIIEEIKNGEIK